MDDFETHTAPLNPNRPCVSKHIELALSNYNEDQPAHVVTDMVMALSILAEVIGVDTSEIQSVFDLAKPDAIKAANILNDNLEG